VRRARGTAARSHGLIARLEPWSGRFVDVERHIVVPDVIVRLVRAGSGRVDFSVQLNSGGHAASARARHLCQRAASPQEQRRSCGAAAAAAGARWFIKNIQQRFDTILRVSEAIVERQKNFVHGELAMRRWCCAISPTRWACIESTISRVTTASTWPRPKAPSSSSISSARAWARKPAAVPPARPCVR
jgi:RNA polymerase sigma-54 factor